MKNKKYLTAFFVLVFLLFAVLFLVRNRAYFIPEHDYENNYENIEVSTKESCIQCHQNTKGYSKYHNPEFIGCASCHLGNTFSNDKNRIHT